MIQGCGNFRSQQVAMETEEVGHQIVADLDVQRESLERARDRLHETDGEITRSRKILKKIYSGVLYNKAVLIAIIVLELIVLIVTVYMKFIANGS